MKLQDLDIFTLEDIESSDHPSDFIKRQDFVALVLRLPEFNKDKIDIISYAFIIEDLKVYFYNREIKKLKEIGDLSKLQDFLEDKVENLIKEIKKYHFEIDSLEDSLYEEKLDSEFMQKWLIYKKDVSLIHRLMFQASIVMELFISYLRKNCNKNYDDIAFSDLLEEIIRVRELAKSAKEKLDNLYDFYRAKVDEKMNRNVYYLTLLSGIFLPLTLITGFFGMNTGGLPYADDPNGTVKVVVWSILLEIIFFLPFIILNTKKIKRYKR